MELLITLSVGGILAALAVPSFIEYIQNNRAITFTNGFTTAFNLARSEAIKRGSSVSVCAASTTAQVACGTAGQWSNGWIVFLDPNGDGVMASTTDRVNIHEAGAMGTTITATQAVVTFGGTGFVTQGASAFTIGATGCTGSYSRLVTIATSGRLSVAPMACP